MADFREMLTKPWAKGVVIAFLAAAILIVIWQVYGAVGTNAVVRSSQDRLLICSETGKSYHYNISVGDRTPFPSPYSGKNTGYLAELCYWTADGKEKSDPTPVLLNQYVGKSGPTFCPDCGRLVVGHNPGPGPGARVPPTKDQYGARRNQSVPSQDSRD